MKKQAILNSLIKLAGPFGYPDLQPSNEPVNQELKERLIDQKHRMQYIDKMLMGRVYRTDPDIPGRYTPLDIKGKQLAHNISGANLDKGRSRRIYTLD